MVCRAQAGTCLKKKAGNPQEIKGAKSVSGEEAESTLSTQGHDLNFLIEIVVNTGI